MEDIFEQIEFIRTLLTQARYSQLANGILEQLMTGGTSGERLILVCARLLGIKEKYVDAYSIIKSEADELIKYCRSIGMHPFPNYPN